MRQLVLFVLAMGLLTPVLLGQTLVRGRVYDRLSRKTLPQVRISLVNGTREGISDQKGIFQIADVPPGVYKIRFSHPDYHPVVKILEIQGERIFSAGASLTPVGLAIEQKLLSRPHGYPRDPFYSPHAQTSVQWNPAQMWQALTLAEGLQRQVQASRTDPHYATPSIQLRGLGPQRLNWTYETLPISPSAQRPDRWLPGALMDPFELENIEIQRGTGGTLYGPEGSAGTIHLQSHVPAFSGQGSQWHGQLRLQGQQPSPRFSSQAHISFHGKRVAIQGGGSIRRWQDIETRGGNRIDSSGFDTRSVNMTLAWQPHPRHKLVVGYRSNGQANAALARGARIGALPETRTEASHDMSFLRWEYYGEKPWVKRIRAVLGYQGLGEMRRGTSPTGGADLPMFEEQINTWAGRVEHVAEPFAIWQFVSGISITLDQTAGLWNPRLPLPGNISELETLPDGGLASSTGAFTVHTFDLLKLHVVFGGRVQVDTRQNLGPYANITDWQRIGGAFHVSGMYPLSQHYQVVANLQSGYRAPSLRELGGVMTLPQGIVVPADEDFVRERSFTSEVGLKVLNDRWEGNVMLYRTFLRDRIGYWPATWMGSSTLLGLPVYQPQNLGLGYVTGVEVNGRVALGRRATLYGQLQYAFGEDLRRGLPMPTVPPLSSRLGLHLRHPRGLWGSVEWRYAGLQNRLSPEDLLDPAIGQSGPDAWNLLDIQVGFVHRRGSLTIGGHNLLDADAQFWGAAIPEPGRRLISTLQLRF